MSGFDEAALEARAKAVGEEKMKKIDDILPMSAKMRELLVMLLASAYIDGRLECAKEIAGS